MIQWVAAASGFEMPPAMKVPLMRRAILAQPDRLSFRSELGRALYKLGSYRAAVETFEETISHAGREFTDWAALADCYLQMGQPSGAIRAAEAGISAGFDSAFLRLRYGTALRDAGRPEDATKQYRSCVELGDHQMLGLWELLRPLAQQGDGQRLHDFFDSLPPELAETVPGRANRAIAFSRLGRVEEARALVDLDKNVARVEIDFPPEFVSLEKFNEALAREISQPGETDEELDIDIAYSPDTARRPATTGLLDRIQCALADYAASGPARGLDTALQSPPARVSLYHGTTVLRRDGAHGEHIHPMSYVSSVYYVQVPESVASSGDDRGALTLGGCSRYTAGYEPCWGTRRIKPVEGTLVVFPPHVFHDVVPSGTSDPRISLAADMQPVSDEVARHRS